LEKKKKKNNGSGTFHRIAFHRITFHRMTLHRITFHRIAFHRMVTFHRILSLFDFSENENQKKEQVTMQKMSFNIFFDLGVTVTLYHVLIKFDCS